MMNTKTKPCALINELNVNNKTKYKQHIMFKSVNELARFLEIPQNSASDRLVRFKHKHPEVYFATDKRRDNIFRKAG